MDKGKQKFFKEKILSAIKILHVKIAELKEVTKPISPDVAIGRISRMDAINNKSVNEATLRTAENKLTKLEMAIEKVNDSKFGICIRCGQEIPEGRLMIMPESIKCVNCAQQ
ncbi:MAG: TraR/DksA C4-type zinc finger protein [Flavobacteriales bacterium]|nr:TraR/DksA C4-type zinc finger protein [Flavobacteriales bacterium]